METGCTRRRLGVDNEDEEFLQDVTKCCQISHSAKLPQACFDLPDLDDQKDCVSDACFECEGDHVSVREGKCDPTKWWALLGNRGDNLIDVNNLISLEKLQADNGDTSTPPPPIIRFPVPSDPKYEKYSFLFFFSPRESPPFFRAQKNNLCPPPAARRTDPYRSSFPLQTEAYTCTSQTGPRIEKKERMFFHMILPVYSLANQQPPPPPNPLPNPPQNQLPNQQINPPKNPEGEEETHAQ